MKVIIQEHSEMKQELDECYRVIAELVLMNESHIQSEYQESLILTNQADYNDDNLEDVSDESSDVHKPSETDEMIEYPYFWDIINTPLPFDP